MTWFDYFKSKFGVESTSPYFSTINMMCGTSAGLTSWCIIFPLENISRRMQAQGKTAYAENYKGIFDCAKKVYRNHGIKGFYFGLKPAWWKVFLYAGLMLTVNEKVKAILRNYMNIE